MNLLFAINRSFVPLFLDCLRSIVSHGGASRYVAYILHSDLEQPQMDIIEKAAGPVVDCHFIPIDLRLFEGFPETERYPRQIYYRIAAPLLLPKELTRILYLDVDTVIINSLQTLYETEFEGAYLAACTHIRKFLTNVNRARLGIRKKVAYVNTGVMLLNLPLLRENLRMEDIRDFALRKQNALLLPDQDIITALYGDRIKLLDTLRYNLSDRMLAMHNLSPQNEKLSLDWIRKNTVIIHYCGKWKPWKGRYHRPLGIFYQEAVKAVKRKTEKALDIPIV